MKKTSIISAIALSFAIASVAFFPGCQKAVDRGQEDFSDVNGAKESKKR
jgi:hypothetical protein